MHPENRQILLHRLREGSEHLERGVLVAPLKDVVDRVAIKPGFARQAALAHRPGRLHRLAKHLSDPVHVDGTRRHVTPFPVCTPSYQQMHRAAICDRRSRPSSNGAVP